MGLFTKSLPFEPFQAATRAGSGFLFPNPHLVFDVSMGSISQFFDLPQPSSSKKLVAHKRQGDGHEAPRNSLEFCMETSHSYNVIQEDIPYSCQVKQSPSKMSYRSNDAPVERLIDEEMSKRINNKSHSPSVVARLMGMDALPSESKPTTHTYQWKDEKPRSSLPRKEATNLSSSHHASSLSSTSIKKAKQDIVSYDIKKETIQSTNRLKMAKLQPREHPQEELLQKFKKDFEAWQTSKVWEKSRTLEAENHLQQAKVNQTLAQENLSKGKMAQYWESKRYAAYKKPTTPKGYASINQPKTVAEQQIILPRENYMNKQLASTKFIENQDRFSSPTKIVILRPSVEMSDDIEGSWSGSPELLEKEASMQDFLEEVKERLKSEILGKTRNNTTPRGFTTKPSFGERSEDTKQFARHIAKQIRESVSRDLGTSLVRSESTRSYKSEFQLNGPEFPEFVNRNTRKLLEERLKNVIKNETDVEIPLAASGRSRMTQERVKSQSMHGFSKLEKESGRWEDKKPSIGSKIIRGVQKDAVPDVPDAEPTSPRNLVRSFSAPVSGTTFAKLLLQDQHVLTGAHIRHKHEASEHSSAEVRRRKKDGFNLKGTVSTLRQNFTLKGKLFGKKTHSVDESAPNEFDSSKALLTVPSIVVKVGSVQENSTEVPPSPASVSSSSLDEFCQPGVPSPVSPLQAPFIEDQSAVKVITESSSVLAERRSLSQHGDHGGFEVAAIEESYEHEPVEVEGHAQTYIRDILIASGLYEGEIFNEAFPKWDASKRPIPRWVFDEVEEAYRQKGKLDGAGSLFRYGDASISHKLLFDLTNEALPRILKPTTSSLFKNWVASPNTIPRRKKLLDDLWWQIQVYINPTLSKSNSVDGMVAQDVLADPWCTILHEDLYITMRKMELVILEVLIDECTSEMLTSPVHEMRS